MELVERERGMPIEANNENIAKKCKQKEMYMIFMAKDTLGFAGMILLRYVK
jgi:hypothetical protein